MKRRQVPYVLDRSLALLKYAVLAFILYITWTSGELLFRAADPCYALISRHGKDITIWAYVVSGAVVLGSLFVMVPFCRWLCPLAAIFHAVFAHCSHACSSRRGDVRRLRHLPACLPDEHQGRPGAAGLPRRAARLVLIACRLVRSWLTVRFGGACRRAGADDCRRSPYWSSYWPVIGAAVAATYAFPLPSFCSVAR